MEYKYPIEFSELRKGDTLSASRLETILECKAGTPEYALKLLGFREHFERWARDNGTPYCTATKQGALLILTDPDAAMYENNMVDKCMHRVTKHYCKMLSVDEAKLSDKERGEHERNILVKGRMVQGAIMGRQGKLSIAPYKRDVPGLPE